MRRLVAWARWRVILLLAALTPPCRRIVQLASANLERPLSPWARLRVRVHLGMCAGCERYFRQLDFLRNAARRSAEHPSEARLAADAKERLRQRLRCAARG